MVVEPWFQCIGQRTCFLCVVLEHAEKGLERSVAMCTTQLLVPPKLEKAEEMDCQRFPHPKKI